MIASSVRCGCLSLLAVLLPSVAHACDSDSHALFKCDAAKSRKFIELCAPSPLDPQSGYLLYRFGSLDKDDAEKAVELEYPAEGAGSLKRFYAATYTRAGVYTQSVRFVSGTFGYTVFTRARDSQVVDAGVEVRDRKSGKTSIVSCSERPRFYIYDHKGLVPCDNDVRAVALQPSGCGRGQCAASRDARRHRVRGITRSAGTMASAIVPTPSPHLSACRCTGVHEIARLQAMEAREMRSARYQWMSSDRSLNGRRAVHFDLDVALCRPDRGDGQPIPENPMI
jgi:hypothetical protein